MLVLSRRKDESIMVGDNVEITIISIRHNEIQLGINAPKSIQVHRKEVYGRIHFEKIRNEHLSLNRRNNLVMAIRT